MNKKVIIALAVVVVLGGAIWAFIAIRDQTSTDSTTANDQPASNSQSSTPSNASSTSATDITYTDQGFSPKSLTVKAGTMIKIINKSSGPLEFSSDDHPTHTKHPEFNLDTISAGSEETLEAKTGGTWGYHNHLRAQDTGIIIVE
jgi:plastocyanin